MFWNRNTKFHQIILIGIFSILIGSSEQFKILNGTENQIRLNSCGNFDLPQDSKDANGVNITQKPYELNNVVTYTGSAKEHVYATATLISPHHVLTSSYVVLDDQKKWRQSKQLAQCSHGSADLTVPPQELEIINHYHLNQATILNVCNLTNNQLVNDDVYRNLMLAEISETFENYFCLANDYTHIDGAELLDSYGRAWDDHGYQLYHRKLKFVHYGKDPYLMYTEAYIANHDFASALVKEKDGKKMLLGIGMGFKGHSDGKGEARFYSIANIQNRICSLTGICEAPKTTTTTTTTTTTPTPTTPTPTNPTITIPLNHPPTATTSQRPSTLSTSSEFPKISATSATIPHLKTPPTSIPSKAPEDSEPQETPDRRLEVDVDEEYEEYLARKKESEKDYEDVDDDIVVSRDFFTDGGKRELSVFVLLLIVVMGFVQ
ncbi:hypothetical protein B9Z55_002951 [Caenorhabditis nigoni]|uniref:Peptidase S1 domain-containing protein n=1 Tax=Caenorhabditis nigoni TaxID=1611254 RepID=A0A2G5VMX1_9PELO|nr:hypothetical protein B9Z55_002951 [Caenorhabditis nigoni]